MSSNNKDKTVVSINDYLTKEGISDTDLSRYSITNILTVVNKGTNSYYNLCNTINFKNLDKLSVSQFYYYTITQKDTWTNLAYKFFGTIDAWWILCKFNSIKNPFQSLKNLKMIKIPTQEMINSILEILE